MYSQTLDLGLWGDEEIEEIEEMKVMYWDKINRNIMH